MTIQIGYKPHVRWCVRRDMDEMLAIEQMHSHPWIEEDILCFLRQSNHIGMIAEYKDKIVGHMLYSLHKYHLELQNFRIHPDYSMDVVGGHMIDKLKSKLSEDRRIHTDMQVRESNLPLLLFLKSQGFVAEDLIHGHYNEEDSILMVYELG